MPNILDLEVRKQIIADINSDENKKRKNESIRRFDIYQKRQARYLREQLVSEYSKQTVNEMRVISSINLGSRIVDAQASLYTSEPTRTFSKSNGTPLSDAEKKQMDALYRANNFNVAMKRSNRYYKLEQQGAIQIIPRDGVIHARVLLPHHYDVVPNEFNPEMADAYVINVYDRSLLYNQALLNNGMQPNYSVATDSDQINQITADSDDFKSKSSQRHIWWSKDFNFITNGHGAMIDEMGRGIPADIALIGNPIQELPFIDIASGKEFEFWIRQGNDVIEFSLDFAVLLSDTAEINKRQGYSQAIVHSIEPPKDMLVGPNRIMHMKLDPNKEVQPKFEWANPSPDMDASAV